jgi:phosphatidylserine/phosphatidylglycerophosphate/cardiolipin synthase-like enzyme
MTRKPEDWLPTSLERGNPATLLDERHAGKAAWSTGNQVRPLVHGAVYFAELLAGVNELRAGDTLLFTDWRGDCDELLAGAGSEVAHVLCAAARRGVMVRRLVWRSHPDRLRFSARENRHLGDVIKAAGGECLLDTRVRPGGSHHQKFVVLCHPGRPELDVAYVGGIDLSHSRHDDAGHAGDGQAQPMAAVYGDRPPWHDIQVAIRGPAVGDVEAVFRERWEDPAPLSCYPVHRLRPLGHRQDTRAGSLPPQLPDPAPRGSHTVQLLRTYPNRRRGYGFAPDGERSIARSYLKVLRRARSLVYLEDQYLWSHQVKACIIDDVGASIGSDNFNRRSWTHDSELSCAVLDETLDPREPRTPGGPGQYARAYARDPRLTLAREHLDRPAGDDADLCDPRSDFAAFARSAAVLEAWRRRPARATAAGPAADLSDAKPVPVDQDPGQRRCTSASMTPTGARPRCDAPAPSDRSE